MIQTLGLAGAGTMGMGIAQVFLLAGYRTRWYDARPEQLEKGIAGLKRSLNMLVEKGKCTAEETERALSLLQPVHTASDLIADLVLEAIVEVADLKKKFFAEVAEANGPETLLCSNTSSIAITALAAGIKHPERFAGVHFFNPAALMKLVEVVEGAETSAATTQKLYEWVNTLGKSPIVVKDSPGFIVNRVARPYYTESLKLAEERVAQPEQIDRILESAGFKMGAFRLMDLIGNDINFEVTNSLFRAFHGEPRFRPSRLQEQKVVGGQLGKKTGKGFYSY